MRNIEVGWQPAQAERKIERFSGGPGSGVGQRAEMLDDSRAEALEHGEHLVANSGTQKARIAIRGVVA